MASKKDLRFRPFGPISIVRAEERPTINITRRIIWNKEIIVLIWIISMMRL